MSILDKFDIDEDKRNNIVRFYISGLMGIVNEWLEDDCKDDVECVISIMQYCVKSL